MISERQRLIFKNVIALKVTLQVYDGLCVIRTGFNDGRRRISSLYFFIALFINLTLFPLSSLANAGSKKLRNL